MSSRKSSAHFVQQMPAKRQASITAVDLERKTNLEQHNTFLRTHDAETAPSTTADEFLNSRATLVRSEIKYQQECLDGLSEISKDEDIDTTYERDAILHEIRPLLWEWRALSASKRGLSQEVSETLTVSKRRKTTKDEPTASDFSRVSAAYVASIQMYVEKFNAGSTTIFDRKVFRKALLEFYDAKVEPEEPTAERRVWCHLTGQYWHGKRVTAAHLIPKCLSNEVVEQLFGSNEGAIRGKPRNGLLLLRNLEKALDQGQIAFVPIPSAADQPSRWKCILLDLNLRQNVVDTSRDTGRPLLRFVDVEHKELTFLNDNRPAKRFLYFRFVMSLLSAIRLGNRNVFQQLSLNDTGKSFWPTPGDYIRRSTLTEFARNISGLELPEALTDATTFEDNEHELTTQIREASLKNTRLAIEVRDHIDVISQREVGGLDADCEDEEEGPEEDDGEGIGRGEGDDAEDLEAGFEIEYDSNQIRSKINQYLKSGEMKVGEFQDRIFVTSRSYYTFMNQKGAMAGSNSSTYHHAHNFFVNREKKGIKIPRAKKQKVDKDNGKEGASDKSKSKAKAKSKADDEKYDVSSITLPGEEKGQVPFFDTCDDVRIKIRAHLRLPGMVQTEFARTINKTYEIAGDEREVHGVGVGRFLGKSGPIEGNTMNVFYAAYVYFEKLRIKQDKPKSKKRQEMEKVHGRDGMNTTIHSKRPIWCSKGTRPYVDKYGKYHFMPSGAAK